MNYRIPLSPSHFSGQEQKYIDKAFAENMISSSYGSNITDFESKICEYINVKACTALTSGTAAIHLALILLGIKEGDEVICSTFTFSATVNPILYLKATPIFVDSENVTWNMCPHLLETSILDRMNKGKKPKAIVLVHLYGMPSKMDEIMMISRKYNIPVIEDAAEAIGSTYKGLKLGSLGDIGIFSFNGNKIITTSGGGALVSNNSAYCDKALFLATQARDEAPHYQHSQIGYNYRMTNISAGIGVGQMEMLNLRVKARRKNFYFYKKELATVKEIYFIDEPQGFFSNRWLTTLLTDSFEYREKLRIRLKDNSIESRPLWKPMHLQPVFSDFPNYLNGNSENFFERGLCLPSGSNLTQDNMQEIVDLIKSY
ncbi:pyridoxal phosphate-dependent aminotransferase [Aureibaculum algae]|uniref:Pyridoxal phosphate-dependent aminotransferase n=1 Tax=Aureibaculum algae TaxID=2584122 RepID=A0A5B7TU32_9FLAO|nr:DegT/DnrJ/EryC1/StrS family aminotransferase [Aureibaculum algae]QCX38831.1 pyridoxal phosphate-dependent aminotransferase [Aureibaculum algae]